VRLATYGKTVKTEALAVALGLDPFAEAEDEVEEGEDGTASASRGAGRESRDATGVEWERATDAGSMYSSHDLARHCGVEFIADET
jgi:hypothetical protein